MTNPIIRTGVWGRTLPMKERLADDKKLVTINGVPYFRGSYNGKIKEFRIISQDTPILNGVCIGKSPREVIYVGSESYALNNLLVKVKQRAIDHGIIEKTRILPAIYETVKETFIYGNDKVEEILDQRNLWHDGMISLGEFIRAKAGACRQMALTCGGLIEKCKFDAELNRLGVNPCGKVSIDRNQANNAGHTWARYTCYDGRIIILDTAQSFFGKLNKDTMVRIQAGQLWPYNRPGENY